MMNINWASFGCNCTAVLEKFNSKVNSVSFSSRKLAKVKAAKSPFLNQIKA